MSSVHAPRRWQWVLDTRVPSATVPKQPSRRFVPCNAVKAYHGLPPVSSGGYDLSSRQRSADSKVYLKWSAGSTPIAPGNAVPDQQLFSQIKKCHTWLECQQLLVTNARHLDAMLISTLVTQTVYVRPQPQAQEQQNQQQQQQQQHSSSSSLKPSFGYTLSYGDDASQQHQERPDVGSEAALAAGAAKQSNRDGSSNRRRSTSKYLTTITNTGSSNSQVAGFDSRKGGKLSFHFYLRQLAHIALHCCGNFRPQQLSNVLWGLAKCGYRPEACWLKSYLAQAELRLMAFQPKNLAQLIWALASMKTVPPRHFSANFLAESSDKMAGFKPIDIANTIWALAVLQIQPPQDWLMNALAVAEQQWARFKAQELGIVVWGFAKLHVNFMAQHSAQQQALSGGSGLQQSGLQTLLTAAGWMLPCMTPQQVSNLLWGLAVSQAGLAPLQSQYLANQALLVLHQAPACSCSHALCSITWSLTKLQWSPTIQQAQQLLLLLQQHERASALSTQQATLLLWCLGKLRIRPPEQSMQQLMLHVQLSLAAAAPVDAVQVLLGCRKLGWRPSKVWWKSYYRETVGMIEVASAGELAQILAATAAVHPLKPHTHWWDVFWLRVSDVLDDTFQARGLSTQQQRQLVRQAVSDIRICRSSSKSNSSNCVAERIAQGPHGAATPPAAAADGIRSAATASMQPRHKWHQQSSASSNSGCAADAVSNTADTCSSSDSHSNSWQQVQQQQKQEEEEAPAAATAMAPWPGPGPGMPWLGITQGMHAFMSVRSAAAASAAEVSTPVPVGCHDITTHKTGLMLLWACARLQKLMPQKVLWQLLLIVVLDIHCYSPAELTTLMWSIGTLLACKGLYTVQCQTMLQLLTVAAQWRLHMGMAGSNKQEWCYKRALRFMAHGARMKHLLALNYKSRPDAVAVGAL